jgi:hypothetical protein
MGVVLDAVEALWGVGQKFVDLKSVPKSHEVLLEPVVLLVAIPGVKLQHFTRALLLSLSVRNTI